MNKKMNKNDKRILSTKKTNKKRPENNCKKIKSMPKNMVAVHHSIRWPTSHSKMHVKWNINKMVAVHISRGGQKSHSKMHQKLPSTKKGRVSSCTSNSRMPFLGVRGWLFLVLLLVGLPQTSARVQNPARVSWSASQTGLEEASLRQWGENAIGLKKQQQPSLTRVAANAREVVCCEPALGAAAVSSGNCADGLLGMKYGNVTWPFGAWMFIWKLVFSLIMDSRCFWFFIKEFGNFLISFL